MLAVKKLYNLSKSIKNQAAKKFDAIITCDGFLMFFEKESEKLDLSSEHLKSPHKQEIPEIL
jgi:hypothetical protein